MSLPGFLLRQRRLALVLLLLASIFAVPIAPGSAAARQDQEVDVVLPRGDVGRGGAMPGSGPDAEPETAWTFAAGGVVMGLAAAGETLFTAVKDPGLLVALDAASGEEQWRVEFGEEATVFGPTLAGDLAVVGVWDAGGNAVVAVDQESGDEVWRSEQDTLPTEPTVVDDMVLVTAEGGLDASPIMLALDAETGAEVWTLDLGDARPGESVAVADDLAFVANYGDGLGLWAFDVATGEEVWTFTEADKITGNPLAGDGVVLIPDYPTFWALDAETGEELWSVRGPSAGGGGAMVDGVAYLSFEEEVRAVDAESGEELWTAPVVGVAGPAAVTGDVAYVAAWLPSDERGSHWVYAFDTTSGDELWSIEMDQTLSGNQPIVFGGLLYVDTGESIVALGDAGAAGSSGNGGDSGASAEGEAGEYESAEYGFVVEWDGAWTLDEGRSGFEDGSDQVWLTGEDADLIVVLAEIDVTPEEVIAFFLDERTGVYDDVEVLDESADRELAWIDLTYEADGDTFREYVEVRVAEDGEGIWLIRVVASDDAFSGAFDAAQADVVLDGETPFVGGPEESRGGGDEAEEEAGTYESPQYGYTLTYDTAEWEVTAEDDDEDDAYDQVQFSNGVSFVSLIGDPDYDADELDGCLADYLAGLEESAGVEDVEALVDEDGDPIEGEEDGIAFAAYSYAYTGEDGDEMDVVRYASCQDLGDGVTLVVLQTTTPDDYEDEFEAREELLEGLDAG